MTKLKVVGGNNDTTKNTLVKNVTPISVPKQPNSSNFITKDDLENIFEKYNKQVNPDSSLTPEAKGLVKAVKEINDLKVALKDPTSLGIEQGITTFTSTMMESMVNNLFNQGQPRQAPPQPLINRLAEIFVNNASANLPQILDSAKNLFGQDRMQRGFDAGLGYLEQQQNMNNISNIVLQLDENNGEHISYYAQLMGITNFDRAKQKLIEHKIDLHNEQIQYQEVQSGNNDVIKNVEENSSNDIINDNVTKNNSKMKNIERNEPIKMNTSSSRIGGVVEQDATYSEVSESEVDELLNEVENT